MLRVFIYFFGEISVDDSLASRISIDSLLIASLELEFVKVSTENAFRLIKLVKKEPR